MGISPSGKDDSLGSLYRPPPGPGRAGPSDEAARQGRGNPICKSAMSPDAAVHVACHAAALAWALRRKPRLGPAKEELVGDAEADRLRSRPERDWA